jgi:HK97 family phage major capsid protein
MSNPVLEDVKKSVEALAKTFEQGRGEFDAKVKAIVDEKAGEVQDALKKATDDINKKYEDLEEKQKKLNAALNRKKFENMAESKKAIAHKEATKVREWMKDHIEAPGSSVDLSKCIGEQILNETKDLSVGDDTQAGYTVRPQIETMIDEYVEEFSVFRQNAQVISLTNSDHIERLVNRKGGVGATRDGETERATNEDTGSPTLDKQKIFANFMRASVNITQQLLDDSGFNLLDWIQMEAAEDFNLREDTEYFIGRDTGRNVNEMRGILTYPAGTSYGQIEQVNSGSSGAFTTDGLLKLVWSVKEAYHGNARFYAQRASIFTNLFTLKDAEDRYYLVPNWREGVQFTLLGYPIHMAPAMPSVAADSLSLAFGNFQRGYTIVDRQGLSLMRDPYTAYPVVKFRFGKRTGGDVANFEAIKIQKLSV